jgi:hypothetical protein
MPLPEPEGLSTEIALAAIWWAVEFATSKDSTLGVPSTTFDSAFNTSDIVRGPKPLCCLSYPKN